MTFSIAARCARTGMFGVAVSSSSPAVAARCAFIRAGVGAVTSQNVTDPALGPVMLDLMGEGRDARSAVEEAARATQHRDYRQLTAVDRQGTGFAFTGDKALGTTSASVAENVACAGNLLANDGVPGEMVDAYRSTGGHLVDRIIAAMRAALSAGGEAGPVHSAGLLVAREVPWPIVDLRVDWLEESCPIERLAAIWEVFRPQVEDYVIRALDPGRAPGYGVPGDEG